MKPISYARHRFPPDVIRHTVWLYLRFTLSYRDVSRGRATAAPRHRVTDGADPQRHSHPVYRLPGRDQRRQAAERTRASQSGRPADARDQLAWWAAALKAAREKS